jgi:hypothetical protein
MGIGFAIIAHDDPQQLRKLLKELRGYPVAIHIDLKKNLEEFDCCLEEMDAMHSFVKNRIKVRWGGYSVVRAMILAGNQVSSNIRGDDHIVFLSGHCFPLKPITKLQEYLDSCDWKQHIRAFDSNSSTEFSINRWKRRHWFDVMHLPINLGLNSRILRKLLYFTSFFFKVKSEPGILTVIGSQWISITKECFDDVTRMISEKKFSFLKNAFAPDEMVFHTAIYSTKWRLQTQFRDVESNPTGEISKMANLHVLDPNLSGNFNLIRSSHITDFHFFTRKISSANFHEFLEFKAKLKTGGVLSDE